MGARGSVRAEFVGAGRAKLLLSRAQRKPGGRGSVRAGLELRVNGLRVWGQRNGSVRLRPSRICRNREGEAPSEPITPGSCHGHVRASPENWEGERTREPKMARSGGRGSVRTLVEENQEGDAPSEPNLSKLGRASPNSRGVHRRVVPPP